MAVAAFAFAVSSGLLAAALPAQQPWIAASIASGATNCNPKNPLPAAGTYYGSRGEDKSLTTLLRISNGGAGLSGLVGALANAFIDHKLSKSQGLSPFKIEWVKGDTTETLHYLSTGQADVGITYNKAAECQAISDGVATRRVYGFRDHFYLVGPPTNPAGLKPYVDGLKNNENVLTQFQKIVRTGNNATQEPPTRFLSRYDKSATNIKDSELFIAIGQVPWGLAYSKWYHQYTMYPIDALTAAALLKEYTITDRGTWLSTNKTYTDMLVRYNEGTDDDQTDPNEPEKPADPLLNPGFFLTSANVCEDNQNLANEFLDWIVDEEGGQSVVGNFKGKTDPPEVLYTRAPTRSNLRIRDCSITGV